MFKKALFAICYIYLKFTKLRYTCRVINKNCLYSINLSSLMKLTDALSASEKLESIVKKNYFVFIII